MRDLEKQVAPEAPPAGAGVSAVMQHRRASAAGKQKDKLRQQTVEPVFGILKSVLGFRQFLLRGLEKVKRAWTLVCVAYNLKRLHRLGAGLKLAQAGYQTKVAVAAKQNAAGGATTWHRAMGVG